MQHIVVAMDSTGITACIAYSDVMSKVSWIEIDEFRKGVILSSDDSGNTEKGGITNGNNE